MMARVKRLLDTLTTVIVSGVLLATIPCLSGCGGGDGGDDRVSGLIRQLGSDDEFNWAYIAAAALESIKAAEKESSTQSRRGSENGNGFIICFKADQESRSLDLRASVSD